MSNPASAVRIERIEGALMPVNSYVVEGPGGLIIVDGQLTVDDARAVRAVVDGFDRPVAAMILTHGHPDHYAGAATILDGLHAPIIATAEVAGVIARDDAEKDRIVGPMMGAAWPVHRRFPDSVVADGEVVKAAGLELAVRRIGSAESHADTVWSLDERTVFSGDVASNDAHAYLLDGHFREWLEILARLEREFDPGVRLHVGHGAPADRSVLARQARYVEAFIEIVTANLDAPPGVRHDAVVDRMNREVTDGRLLFLMELSIEPVADILRETPA